MNIIEIEWVAFERVVIPDNASTTQRREMKKAFYAGVACFFSRLMSLESEKETQKILESLDSELRSFANDIIKQSQTSSNSSMN